MSKAADVIRERGWCQGRMETKDGRVCALKAIKVAYADFGERDKKTCALEDYLEVDSVAVWNDRRVRTKEEVIASLEAAGV